MNVPVEVQLWRVALLFLAGALTDIILSAYTAFRAVFRPRKLLRDILDAVLALLSISVLSASLVLANWGEFRLYVAVSILCGFTTTHYLAADIIYRCFLKTFRQTKLRLAWIKTHIITPASNLFAKFRQAMRFILRAGS